MEAEVFERVHPREYLNLFVQRGSRPDGRALDAARKVSISAGSVTTALGSSMVKIGRTMVVAGVSATAILPPAGLKETVAIDASVELLPLCSSRFRPGRKPEEAHFLCELVLQSVRNMLAPSSFSIEDGALQWSLFLDIYCLDQDGNMEDASILAAIAALHDLKLPDVATTDDGYEVIADSPRNRRIEFKEIIVPVSLAVLVNGTILLDPNASEEMLCDAHITVYVDVSGNVRGLDKAGGAAANQKALSECISLAKKRAKELSPLLKVG